MNVQSFGEFKDRYPDYIIKFDSQTSIHTILRVSNKDKTYTVNRIIPDESSTDDVLQYIEECIEHVRRYDESTIYVRHLVAKHCSGCEYFDDDKCTKEFCKEDYE